MIHCVQRIQRRHLRAARQGDRDLLAPGVRLEEVVDHAGRHVDVDVADQQAVVRVEGALASGGGALHGIGAASGPGPETLRMLLEVLGLVEIAE